MLTTKDTESRERVLKKVRNALIPKSNDHYAQVDLTKSVYKEDHDPLEVVFAKNFTALSGKFTFCENDDDLVTQLKETADLQKWSGILCLEPTIQNLLTKAGIPYVSDLSRISETRIGIGACESLVARYGSVMVSSKQASGRKLPTYPDTHVVIAYTQQIVMDLKDSYSLLKEKYQGNLPSLISNIAGPSRSADIEKTLVMGAHGPKEIFVFLVEG
ncbi:MAG: LUD domain-containing protein [Bacteroidia bacterium]|nr:LUD domain-containing protein [Bacteroidia bacterium]